MAFIDFSLDSRIRKKYVPLTTQQRFLRHLKRVSARNLFIPRTLIQALNVANLEADFKNLASTENGGDFSDPDYSEQYQSLILRLNLAFYFTILYPPNDRCRECLSSKSVSTRLCNCGKLLYRSELIANSNPSWRPFEGSTLCSPSISHFIIRVYYVRLQNEDHACIEQRTTLLTPSSALFNDNQIQQFHLQIAQSNNSGIVDGENSCRDNAGASYAFEAKSENLGTLFLEWNVNLSGLVFVGEEMPKNRRLASNSFIFGAQEGYYTSFDSVTSADLLAHIIPPMQSIPIDLSSVVRKSYCCNTLTRIHMMQYIYQANGVDMQRAKNQLEDAIERTRTKRELLIKIEKIQSSSEFLSHILAQRRERLKNSLDQLSKTESDIFELNATMSNRVQILKEEIHRLLMFRCEKMMETRRRLEYVRNALLHRRRLLAKELFQDIYRIIPFPDFQGYSICGVYLPDAERIEGHDPKMISIALGHVTHLLAIVASLLDINLIYPIIPFGSRSLIIDPNNQVLRDNEKLLPLHSRSSRNSLFFKYGLYLLNRTIANIRRWVGLKTPSMALTLANLYSLFTECLLVDNYNIGNDFTFNRFSTHSPAFDQFDACNSVQNSGEFNQHFLNDINFIKDNDCMIEYLWKEVEQMTLDINNSNIQLECTSSNSRPPQVSSRISVSTISLTTASSSSSSSSSSSTCNYSVILDPKIEDIKQSISKQKQRRRLTSSQRLSQITSSLSSSYASVPVWPTSSTAATSFSSSPNPEEIIRRRRISMVPCFPAESPTHSVLNSSRTSSQTSSLVPKHRRVRSVSDYYHATSHSSQHDSVRSSLTHDNIINSVRLSETFDQSDNAMERAATSNSPILTRPRLTRSLDKGLNYLHHHNSFSSIASSLSNNTGELNRNNHDNLLSNCTIPMPSVSPSNYLNVETLGIRYGQAPPEENRSIEENLKVLPIDAKQTSKLWSQASSPTQASGFNNDLSLHEETNPI